jgi:hypothetical protein
VNEIQTDAIRIIYYGKAYIFALTWCADIFLGKL